MKTSVQFFGKAYYFIIAFVVINCQNPSDPPSAASYGKLIETEISSAAIAGNLLNDDPAISVFIYLPAAYDQNPDLRFPVLYLLHGYTMTNSSFITQFSLKTIFDDYFKSDTVQAMIVVIPNAHNTYRGSFYTNSYVTGNWEDFIISELTSYVDGQYRTIPSAKKRGIAGHSMGGYGAMKIAIRHPDMFSVVYSLSPAIMVFRTAFVEDLKDEMLKVLTATHFSSLNWLEQSIIAAGAAFAPDSTRLPFMCEFPILPDGSLIDSVWQKWLMHDLYSMIRSDPQNIMNLSAVQFDCGLQDSPILKNCRQFSLELNDKGISHVYAEYQGDHNNKISERIQSELLPFFSNNFSE